MLLHYCYCCLYTLCLYVFFLRKCNNSHFFLRNCIAPLIFFLLRLPGPAGWRSVGADRPGVRRILLREARPTRDLPPDLGDLRLDHLPGLRTPRQDVQALNKRRKEKPSPHGIQGHMDHLQGLWATVMFRHWTIEEKEEDKNILGHLLFQMFLLQPCLVPVQKKNKKSSTTCYIYVCSYQTTFFFCKQGKLHYLLLLFLSLFYVKSVSWRFCELTFFFGRFIQSRM